MTPQVDPSDSTPRVDTQSDAYVLETTPLRTQDRMNRPHERLMDLIPFPNQPNHPHPPTSGPARPGPALHCTALPYPTLPSNPVVRWQRLWRG